MRKQFERFAAKYWGQEVAVCEGLGIRHPLKLYNGMGIVDYLQLRSIDSLTDEELDVCTYIESTGNETCIGRIKEGSCEVGTADYLRKRGVLICSDGHTVDQLIEMGWVRITPSTVK